ncbi:MAG TPA: type II secretion system protein N [Steroidobacteraceae bacterium]|nr:type II secretion system protein N [Steroidobacteraceae bacterium]
MRQRTLIAVVGGLVFVGVAVGTLPASLLVSRLPPDLKADGVSGSIWSGSADAIRLRGTPLGAINWAADLGALLHGQLAYEIDLSRPDGFVRGHIAASLGNGLTGENISLELPVTTLNPERASTAWQGDLKGTVRLVRVVNSWPTTLAGAFTLSNLKPPGADQALGTFAIEFDPKASTPVQLVGRVSDVDSPLLVRAQLIIRRDRSYVLDGDVTPRPGAPPEVARAVAFLGAPDSSGRRQFQITGTF